MKQKPKTCQGCKFFTDFIIDGYTPYLSIAQRDRINSLINAGDHGRCIKHSQMTLEPFDFIKSASKNLAVVHSEVFCMLVRRFWNCGDWEEKKQKDKVAIGQGRGLATVTLVGS